MEAMATWEDGPEYAPRVRPESFSSAEVPPLESVPPVSAPVEAPRDRPEFRQPPAEVAPLAALVPTVADRRDPETPFDVVGSTVTSMDSAWGAAHWNASQGAPGHGPGGLPHGLGGSAPAGPLPPALVGYSAPAPAYPADAAAPAGPYPPAAQGYPGNGQPGGPPSTSWPEATPTAAAPWGSAPAWPALTAALPPVAGPPSLPGGFPPPGTPQWFGPGPAAPVQPPAPPAPVTVRTVLAAVTPGVYICLAIGGFVYQLAPIMLAVAFVLSKRITVAADQVRHLFLVVLGFLGLIALAGMMLGRIWFSDWWSLVGGWACFLCWVVLIVTAALVFRALKQGPTRPPFSGYTSNWG